MGATLSIEFTFHYQKMVDRLYLISTPYMHGTLSEDLFLHLAHASNHSPKYLRRFFFLWRSRPLTIPLSFFVLKFRSFRKIIRITLKNSSLQAKQNEDAVEENWISLITFNYAKLTKIKIPIVLFFGKEDILISKSQAHKLQELNPDSKLYFIPRAGHLPPVETPQTLANLIMGYDKISE